jgi:hypothetical protein
MWSMACITGAILARFSMAHGISPDTRTCQRPGPTRSLIIYCMALSREETRIPSSIQIGTLQKIPIPPDLGKIYLRITSDTAPPRAAIRAIPSHEELAACPN